MKQGTVTPHDNIFEMPKLKILIADDNPIDIKSRVSDLTHFFNSKDLQYKINEGSDKEVYKQIKAKSPIYLEKEGMEIIICTDGEQALEEFKKNTDISIVLTDFDMRKNNVGKDGNFLIEGIREIEKDIEKKNKTSIALITSNEADKINKICKKEGEELSFIEKNDIFHMVKSANQTKKVSNFMDIAVNKAHARESVKNETVLDEVPTLKNQKKPSLQQHSQSFKGAFAEPRIIAETSDADDVNKVPQGGGLEEVLKSCEKPLPKDNKGDDNATQTSGTSGLSKASAQTVAKKKSKDLCSIS